MYTKLRSSFRNSTAEISDHLQWIFFRFSILSTFDHMFKSLVRGQICGLPLLSHNSHLVRKSRRNVKCELQIVTSTHCPNAFSVTLMH